MADARMMAQMTGKEGFIAALDQSGGSTPGALRLYGIAETDYDGEEAMFRLMHEMRVRIMTAPAFTGEKVIGAILFEKTMDGEAGGRPVPSYLWEERGVVPFLKVDKGLAAEENGAQVMKPMPDLDALLARAVKKGIFGTKMRSVINSANAKGIDAVLDQQFAVGLQILNGGLMPIIEPEVNIKATDKKEAEALLKAGFLKRLDALPAGTQVMLKLTIPSVDGFYSELVKHPAVVRVVALSGGYSRDDSNAMLAKNPGVIASFSRALTEGLSAQQTDAQFNSALDAAIESIYQASIA
jgi:fructose-bisphosphate aldolase class I